MLYHNLNKLNHLYRERMQFYSIFLLLFQGVFLKHILVHGSVVISNSDTKKEGFVYITIL